MRYRNWQLRRLANSLVTRRFVYLLMYFTIITLQTGCIHILESRSEKLVKYHGKCNDGKDTTILINNREYTYTNNQLSETGKVRNGHKRGYWFYYDKHLHLAGITKHKSDSNGKVILIRNTRW